VSAEVGGWAGITGKTIVCAAASSLRTACAQPTPILLARLLVWAQAVHAVGAAAV
jgi:hypothetical protein